MTIGIAVAYWATGRLGLLLAIPPGYATAAWPPAGIALGAALMLGPRALFGIWLGSFAVNFDPALFPSAKGLLVPTAIGLGAVAQAAVGVTLTRALMRSPLTLLSPRDVTVFSLGDRKLSRREHLGYWRFACDRACHSGRDVHLVDVVSWRRPWLPHLRAYLPRPLRAARKVLASTSSRSLCHVIRRFFRGHRGFRLVSRL
ncbi:MAG: MASE1 domain-containing protein [Deltaproteobacteria bacterium]|nr:MASE1 domain-containing protein [Deltaproteobacteria bacterium]